MRNLIYVFSIMMLCSCGIMRKKNADIDKVKESVSIKTDEKSSTIDTGNLQTYERRITFGASENPFKTPEANNFVDALFNLSALMSPAANLDSVIVDLQKKYNDFSNTGSSLASGEIQERWTNEQKGKTETFNKKSETDSSKNIYKKKLQIDSTAGANIPWYAWLIGIIGGLFLLAFLFKKP